MRFYYILIILLTFNYSILSAQFKKGNLEFDANCAIGLTHSTVEYNSGSASSNLDYLTMSLISGYYLSDGFSIEPEIGYTIMTYYNPSITLLVNASYTYLIPDDKYAYFIRGGYGITNVSNLPGFSVFSGENDKKLDINLLNFGGGFKILISKNALIRIEFGYQYHFKTFKSGGQDVTKTLGIISTSFGFSMFF
jgi:hypothetical protein